ncbi:exonuclease SbcCD subunit D C-terminal domain-containing protein [Wenyingzhuangia aestuarii]|uniref:exonuclease SbcCD subunit D C-terminal domain-containing protein n=1 Tax=Wenyingzhuangia aestuarii TaxID=1647582 RepID=UPI0014392D4C|nr:exonuclease SbcCD subunit D C-terminal domain-containing protein [Wenyingzhuangia aestuarii]NJB84117.1 exonuclease SbcD [Wenyingzhuangia aestuarii]
MKILHTADWHLGHRLHEQSQYQEQQLFLDWLTNHIISENYEVLLISGDVFDTGMPSNQSLTQYYDFLVGLRNTCCKHIVVTGGNHDSPGTLNAPKQLLNALHIDVVGKATEDCKDELFYLETATEAVWIAAVPYLRDQDVRRAVAGESFEDMNERYKAALIKHYTDLAEHCVRLNTHQKPVIAMGHLFAIGGSISDSEKDISVGNLGHIGADDFPEIFDYVALGHLHRPQWIGGKEHIRYSGSPNILSFSEIGYDKKIIGLTIADGEIQSIEETTLPVFRNVLRVQGDVPSCLTQLNDIQTNEYNLEPWIEVVLDNDTTVVLDTTELKKQAEDLGLRILKVSLKNKRQTVGLETLMENAERVKNLKPMDVFEKKCEEQGIDLKEHKELAEAFKEALSIAQETNT